MKRTFILFLTLMLLVVSIAPVMADMSVPEEPVEFKTEMVVDSGGGRFDVGFVNVEFKKRFLDDFYLPQTFEAEVYAEDGKIYIELAPDTVLFYKKVHLRVDQFSGYIYDRVTGENIYVEVKKQQILAPHFSRYCIFD